MPCRTEVNLTRLLARCEVLTTLSPEGDKDIFRLEKYVETLKSQMQEVLQLQHPIRPDVDAISEYSRKLDHFNRLLETERLNKANKKATTAETALGIDHLLVPTCIASESLEEATTRQKSKLRAGNDLRAELLGQSNTRRRKNGPMGKSTMEATKDETLEAKNEDMESVLAKERQTQEELTEQMVSMARALKGTTEIAGAILKTDNQVLDQTNALAEQNKAKLMTEHERLRKHMEVYGSCWIWLSLLIVSVVFILMIVFIRLVPAPRA